MSEDDAGSEGDAASEVAATAGVAVAVGAAVGVASVGAAVTVDEVDWPGGTAGVAASPGRNVPEPAAAGDDAESSGPVAGGAASA